MKKVGFTLLLFLFTINLTSVSAQKSTFEEVAALENVNIKLLARTDEGFLRDFILMVGEKEVKYPEWVNVDNPDYKPKLYSVDLTNDGQEEIVVILTTKKGNGIYVNDVHLFEKMNDATDSIHEIFFENLQAEVQKFTSFTVTNEHLKINLKEKKKYIIPNNELPQSDKKINLSVEHFVLYKIKDQKLRGVLLVEQDKHKYIGSIIATYAYKNGVMVIDDMEFKRH